MSPSLNKTTALAVYGILFASFLQSVCLGEVVEGHEPRKRHLRSVHNAPRTFDAIHIPDRRRREARDPPPEVGAEAPIVEQQLDEEIVRHSPPEDDTEAPGDLEPEPDEEIVRHSPPEDDAEAPGDIGLEPDEEIVRYSPPEINAEAPGDMELEPDEEIVRHSQPEDDTEAPDDMELEPEEDIVRHSPVPEDNFEAPVTDPMTEAPQDRDQDPEVGAEASDRDEEPEVGAEAPVSIELEPEEDIVRHSPVPEDNFEAPVIDPMPEAPQDRDQEPEVGAEAPDRDEEPEVGAEAPVSIELEPEEDIVRHSPVSEDNFEVPVTDPMPEAPQDRDQEPEVGAEAPDRDEEPEVGSEAPDRDQQSEVGSEAPEDKDPTPPPVGEEDPSSSGMECVDDPDFIYRSKPDKDCEWLASKNETTTRKICLKRAAKEEEDQTKVYSYCKATCNSVNIKHACDM